MLEQIKHKKYTEMKSSFVKAKLQDNTRPYLLGFQK